MLSLQSKHPLNPSPREYGHPILVGYIYILLVLLVSRLMICFHDFNTIYCALETGRRAHLCAPCEVRTDMTSLFHVKMVPTGRTRGTLTFSQQTLGCFNFHI